MRRPSDRIVEEYGPLITKIAGQVARRYTRTGGDRSFGWRVVEAGEIESALYIRLLEKGWDAAYIQSRNSPEAWLRSKAGGVAKTLAYRRASIRERRAGGGPRSRTYWTHFGDEYDYVTGRPEPGALSQALHPADPDTPADIVIEREALREQFEIRKVLRSDIADYIEGILELLPAAQAEALRLYYLKGQTVEQVAKASGTSIGGATMRLKRGRARIGPSDANVLRVWRRSLDDVARQDTAVGDPTQNLPDDFLALLARFRYLISL